MKPRLAALALLVVLWAMPAFSQGCAMCYSNAAGTTKDGQRAISRAVVVLLIPPVGFMTVGLGLALRFARKRDRDAEQDFREAQQQIPPLRSAQGRNDKTPGRI